MNNYFIILAAGSGKRFKDRVPKQYKIYKNKPLYLHSLDKALESKLFKGVILVINKKHKRFLKNKIKFIHGGKTRQESSFKALNYLKKKKVDNVFIHDAARPNLSIKLLKKLNFYIKKNIAVVPYLNSMNSTKLISKKKVVNLNRNNILLTQTPQCFNFKTLFDLSRKNTKEITDESTLFINSNKKIKFIKGDYNNIKITKTSDLNNLIKKTSYGIGFDIHRLVKNKKLYLGGIKIPFHSGLKGHSDGDVIIHCIIDALLGAMTKKDIGTIYPNNKVKFKNIRSPKLLKPIISDLENKNYNIINLDINLICERPKVSKYRNKIINSLSKLMNINKNIINLKGKTVEKLGLIGKEKAIACESIVSINKYE